MHRCGFLDFGGERPDGICRSLAGIGIACRSRVIRSPGGPSRCGRGLLRAYNLGEKE